MSPSPKARIAVGISSCLLGQSVRYDGGHRRDSNLVDVLGKCFKYLPFCPEVAIGMGTPRPPIHLTGEPSEPRAVGVQVDDLDVTGKLIDCARPVVEACPRISGYVFKRGSPSCGMQQVKVYNEKGSPCGSSPGLYAGVVMRSLPLMPVEDDGRLSNPMLRDSFVERVYVYDRWQSLCDEGLTPAGLIEFHTRHKPLLLCRSAAHYRRLGELIAKAGARDMGALSKEYIEGLMDGLKRRTTHGHHSSVSRDIRQDRVRLRTPGYRGLIV